MKMKMFYSALRLLLKVIRVIAAFLDKGLFEIKISVG